MSYIFKYFVLAFTFLIITASAEAQDVIQSRINLGTNLYRNGKKSKL